MGCLQTPYPSRSCTKKPSPNRRCFFARPFQCRVCVSTSCGIRAENGMGKFRLTDEEQFGVSLGGINGKADEVDTGGGEVPVLV